MSLRYRSLITDKAPITGGSLQIGTGTDNLNQYPAFGLYNYSVSMFLYRASELGDARQITGIDVTFNSYTSGYSFLNQTIKLAHITDNKLNSNVTVSLGGITTKNLTTCKSNFTNTITSGGSKTFTFDTNFFYNGDDNLLLIWENRDGSWTSGYGTSKCTFVASNHPTNTHRSWFKNQDASYPTGYGTVDVNYRMDVKFRY